MENSEATQFRHTLIQKEFRDILTTGEYQIPVETEGIVILSAPPSKNEKGEVIEASPDNKARIEFGTQVARQITAKKLGKTLEEITIDDISQNTPMFILNGETEQLPTMEQLAKETGFPPEKIQLLDCGKRGVGNTKTQFEAINTHHSYRNAKHLTFITNSWHAPRVTRTADANLKPEIDFDVIPVPHSAAPYNVFRVVRGEVKRIQSYSAKGDITRNPQPRS